MDPLQKVTGERDALLLEIRRIRAAVEDHIPCTILASTPSARRLKRELDRPAPSQLFTAKTFLKR